MLLLETLDVDELLSLLTLDELRLEAELVLRLDVELLEALEAVETLLALDTLDVLLLLRLLAVLVLEELRLESVLWLLAVLVEDDDWLLWVDRLLCDESVDVELLDRLESVDWLDRLDAVEVLLLDKLLTDETELALDAVLVDELLRLD